MEFLTVFLLAYLSLPTKTHAADEKFVERFVNINRMSKKELDAYKRNSKFKPQPDFEPPGTNPQPSSAGRLPGVSGQVIGGATATQSQFPWQALLTIDSIYLCGGSLISPEWVLTASHCTKDFTNFDVSLGGVTRYPLESGRITLSTKVKFDHENYDDYVLNNDIALLKLPSAVNINSNINAIRLPSMSDAKLTFADSIVIVSGYGKTSNRGQASNTLNFVDLKVIKNSKCALSYGSSIVISSTLCTASYRDKSTCSGDSGGPLVIKERDGVYTQIGIVSFGSSASCTNNPTGFARVPSFLGWISSKTGIQIRP